MPELTVQDVDLYTRGRLSAQNVETNRTLQRALAACRRMCEWHVTPVVRETVTLDGPSSGRWGSLGFANPGGARILMLPTQRLVTLHSITEDGVTLNGSDLWVSTAGPVRVRKKSYQSWSAHYSSITIDMTHGWDDGDAQDFRIAVLDMCDKFERISSGMGTFKRYRIDDFDREWYEKPHLFDDFNGRLLEPYRLVRPL